MQAVRTALLAFYRAHRRDLPWRRTHDPYAVWVSEIMLQQTQVDTVVPRYGKFLRRFPDIATLAASSESEVCEEWAGLGYYRRARFLQQAAASVVREHGGVVPRDVATLRRLPGVGRYTAGAIASIAYGVEAPLVDGNVTRVLARLFALPGAVGDRPLEARLWTLAEELVRGEDPGDLNQALMELGATVCTPKQPECQRCPVAAHCQALQTGEPTRFPVAKKAAPQKRLSVVFAFIEDRAGVWLEQRPLDGLWPGLWELPSASGPGARARLEARLGVRLGKRLAAVRHVLTHRQVSAKVFAAEPGRARPKGIERRREPLSAPLSGLAKKAIVAALDAAR